MARRPLDPSLLRDELETSDDLQVRAPVAVFVPSRFNRAIFDWMQAPVDRIPSPHLVIEAVAGSGKSTTLGKCLEYLPRGADAIVLAYNTTAAADFNDRMLGLDLKASVEAKTFHSAGFAAVRAFFLRQPCEVQPGKLRSICKDWLSGFERVKYGSFIIKLVELAKAEGFGTPTEAGQSWDGVGLRGLVQHYGLEMEDAEERDYEKAYGLAYDLLQKSNRLAERGLIDFDDQLYLVALWQLEMPRFDWVFVDEGQDTNALRRLVIEKTVRADGRLIVVGDRRQAIYGFTGASHDALDRIKDSFHAQELPLSINYRCSRAVVRWAQQIVPQLEPRPDAPEGSVVEDANLIDLIPTLTPQDAILCRNNAPLVGLVYDLIGQGIGATIQGRDIGKGLLELLGQMRAATVESLVAKLDQYKRREVARYQRREELAKAARVEDKVECLQTIIDGIPEADRTLAGVQTAITGLFTDDKANVLTLSTIHKAKGREWRNVVLYRPDLLPAHWAKDGWQLDQETNLRYVAYTRAKENLFIVAPPVERKK